MNQNGINLTFSLVGLMYHYQIEEAIQGGKLLKEGGYKFDVCYTSVLKRAIHTTFHALDELDQLYIQV